MFHEDVWPPAREWWMAHPDESALGLRLFMVNAELNKTRFLLQSVFTARAWTGIDVATLLEKDKPELCQQVREMLRLNGG